MSAAIVGAVIIIFSLTMAVMAQVNDDQCKVGSPCGPNGICQQNSENKLNCTCPPEFDFVDNNNHNQGCKRIWSEQTCGAKTSKIKTLNNINWPQGDYSILNDTTQESIDDCNCVIAIYSIDKNRCWMKQMPVQHGQNVSNNTVALIKVPISSAAPPPLPQDIGSQNKENRLLVIGIIVLACFSILWVVGSLVFCFYKRGSNANFSVMQAQQHKSIHEGLNSFTYKEIEIATGGFKEELGRGACSRVYKGRLSDGRHVAVKSIDEVAVEQGRGEKEFFAEMKVIGSSHHRNLVQLYGFCFEGSHRLLVYEYMSNGSLERPAFSIGGSVFRLLRR